MIELIYDTTRTPEQIDQDTPILSTGIIDSFDVVALLSAIETHFGARISPQDVDVEGFDTPSRMIRQVQAALEEK